MRTAERDRPRLTLRLKVYAARGRLDRRIAVGDSGPLTPELALRVEQLTDPHSQHELARNLRRVVRHVERCGSRRPISSVAIHPPAVSAGRQAILELAEQLERAASVDPRGILLARSLLTDAASPLFNRYCERSVGEAVHEVHEALQTPAASAAPAGLQAGGRERARPTRKHLIRTSQNRYADREHRHAGVTRGRR